MENLNENQLRAKIAQKLAKIGSKMNGIEMDGRNDHSRYSYISYEQINAYISQYSFQEGISIIPEFKIIDTKTYTTSRGGSMEKITVEGIFDIIDTETGYQISKKSVGSGADSGDKALGKAITETQKRFQMKLFNITSKGDVDPDSETVDIPHQEKWLRSKLVILGREKGRLREIKEILEAEGIQDGNPDNVDFDKQQEYYDLVIETLNSNL